MQARVNMIDCVITVVWIEARDYHGPERKSASPLVESWPIQTRSPNRSDQARSL